MYGKKVKHITPFSYNRVIKNECRCQFDNVLAKFSPSIYAIRYIFNINL